MDDGRHSSSWTGDTSFPPFTVESTTPVMYYRRRLLPADVVPLEINRIRMSLKSGLTAETNWALDALNILLVEKITREHINLSLFPGMMSDLMEIMSEALRGVLETTLGSVTLNADENPTSVESKGRADELGDGTLHNNTSSNIVSTKKSKLIRISFDELLNGPKKAGHPKEAKAEGVDGLREPKPNDTAQPEEALSVNGRKTTIKEEQGRNFVYEIEDMCSSDAEPSLYLATASQEEVALRFVCLSKILRNLSFVKGNEEHFAKFPKFLYLGGKLLLLHHHHEPITSGRTDDNHEDEAHESFFTAHKWRIYYLNAARENMLVCFSNIAGHIDLALHEKEICRPILEGLLHWILCDFYNSEESIPDSSSSSPLLQPTQRIALEALCKLSASAHNTNLLLATASDSQLQRLTALLAEILNCTDYQVIREFSVHLLHSLGGAESRMARLIALQYRCIKKLINVIVDGEDLGQGIASEDIVNDKYCPETVRKAAETMFYLSQHPDNWSLIEPHENTLFSLVTSTVLDSRVVDAIAKTLLSISTRTIPPPD